MRKLVLFAIVPLVTMFVFRPAAVEAADKAEICHYNADGDPDAPLWQLLAIPNTKAVEKHVAHGDGIPGGDVPGMNDVTFDDGRGWPSSPTISAPLHPPCR